MAKISSKDVGVFYVGGYDILGFSTMVGITDELMTEEAHVLGDAWVYHDSTGIRNGQISQNGFFTTETAGSNDAIATTLNAGVTVPAIVGLGDGGAQGGLVMQVHALMPNGFEIQAERGALVKGNAGYESTGRMETGNIIYLNRAVTATENGAAWDSGLSDPGSNTGAQIIVQAYIDLDGAADIEIAIEETTETPGVWAEIASVTYDSDGANSSVLTVASGTTIGANLRAVITYGAGGGGGETANICVSLART